jgi:hypothetical protein
MGRKLSRPKLPDGIEPEGAPEDIAGYEAAVEYAKAGLAPLVAMGLFEEDPPDMTNAEEEDPHTPSFETFLTHVYEADVHADAQAWVREQPDNADTGILSSEDGTFSVVVTPHGEGEMRLRLRDGNKEDIELTVPLAKIRAFISRVLMEVEEDGNMDLLAVCWLSQREAPPHIKARVAECLHAFKCARDTLGKVLQGRGRPPEYQVRNAIIARVAAGVVNHVDVDLTPTRNEEKLERTRSREIDGKKRLLSLESVSSILSEALYRLKVDLGERAIEGILGELKKHSDLRSTPDAAKTHRLGFFFYDGVDLCRTWKRN